MFQIISEPLFLESNTKYQILSSDQCMFTRHSVKVANDTGSRDPDTKKCCSDTIRGKSFPW